MRIAILTFDGFNELNRVKQPGWRVRLCCPARSVTSMNGVTVKAQSVLASTRSAAAALATLLALGCVSPPPTCAERLQQDRGECRKLMDALDSARCNEAAQAAAAQCAAR